MGNDEHGRIPPDQSQRLRRTGALRLACDTAALRIRCHPLGRGFEEAF